ncbi:MAG: twin-arginine translocation signal domain-containing protein, partial [Deltaproteobacteria bacterium]
MSKNEKSLSRRAFIKTAGAVGLGTLVAPLVNSSDAMQDQR